MFQFEKFPVYIKAEEVYQLVSENVLSQRLLNKPLKDQLMRASSSISLNIAEGAGRYTKKDKRNFYVMARGSTQECVAILRLIRLEKQVNPTVLASLHNTLTIINKMLTGLIKKMEENSS